MAQKYIITVILDEEDPFEVLDWILEHSGDDDASVQAVS